MSPSLNDRLLARTPNRRRPLVMHQRWESLLFLHWKIEPERIARTLPPGLWVDTFEGQAYLGIVPFAMRRVRPVGCPVVPGLSNFLELNVRTYVHDEQDVPGVWFYSLDCNQPVAVSLAQRFFHLPYLHSRQSIHHAEDGVIHYHSKRIGTDLTDHFTYRGVGEAKESLPDSLEFFLLERYYLYAYDWTRGQGYRGQVAHAPYRYQSVEVPVLSTLAARYDGFLEMTPEPDHQCFVDGLEVQIYGLEK